MHWIDLGGGQEARSASGGGTSAESDGHKDKAMITIYSTTIDGLMLNHKSGE